MDTETRDAMQQPKKTAIKSGSEEIAMATVQKDLAERDQDEKQKIASTEVTDASDDDGGEDDDDDEIMWDEDAEEEEDNQENMLERMGFLIPSKQAKRAKIEEERNYKKGKRRRTRNEMARARNEHKLHLLVLLSRCILLNEQSDDELLKKLAKAAVPSRFKPKSSITSIERETTTNVEKEEFTETGEEDESEVSFVGISSASMMDFSKLRLFVSWFRNRFFINTNTDFCTPNSTLTNFNSGSRSLSSVIETARGTETELVQVFVTMLRTLHLPCRIVFALKPRTRSSSTTRLKKAKLKTTRANTDAEDTDGYVLLNQYDMHQPMVWAEIWMKVSDDGHTDSTDDDVAVISNPNNPDSVRGNWVHVDVLSNKINDPQSYRSWTQGNCFTRTIKVSDEAPYIIGLSDGNYAMDVTKRYVSRYSQMVCRRVKTNSKEKPTQFGQEERLKLLARLEFEKLKMPNVPLPSVVHWWEGIILGGLRQKAAETLFLRESNYDMNLDKDCPEASYLGKVREATSSEAFINEYDQLSIGVLNEDMPTSDQGFRKHPRFALDSHLKYNQGISPHVKSVGIFKGSKVYDRIYIEELHTVSKWRQKARIVKAEEIEHPVKMRKIFAKGRDQGQQESKTEINDGKISKSVETGKDDVDGDDNEMYVNDNFEPKEGGDTMISYYGEWQTENFVPPVVVDDEIPKNKYGNVELFCPQMCPFGAVHLRSPCVDQAARKLGVSFARAVVGWEKQYPKFEGIVVSINFEASVREAAQEIHVRNIEKEEDKRLKRIAARWEILAKHLLARDRVQQKYGQR